MAQVHPSELELLEHVEGNLEAEAASAVRAHLEACPACAATVGELERGRDALRSSPLLELPAERRALILTTLPAQERDRRRVLEFLSSPKHVLAVLAPVAVAAAVVVAVTTLSGKGGGQREGAPVAAATTQLRAADVQAQPEAGGAATAGGAGAGSTTAGAATAVPATAAAEAPLTAQGSADDVATLLEKKGFHVTVAGDTVTVTAASEEAVRKALGNRPPGRVHVVILPG